MQNRQVIGQHIGAARLQLAQQAVEIHQSLAQQWTQHGWIAVRVQRVAAGIVEWQAERKAQAITHLGHALQHLLAREQIQPPELVVHTKVTPRRTFGALLPARVACCFLIRHIHHHSTRLTRLNSLNLPTD